MAATGINVKTAPDVVYNMSGFQRDNSLNFPALDQAVFIIYKPWYWQAPDGLSSGMMAEKQSAVPMPEVDAKQ